jgi:RHS repeat-associated protein
MGPGPATGPERQRFTGKERDDETFFDYFGARYYRNVIGRFTSVDPFLDQEKTRYEPQQWNRYIYVRNNPYRFIDPDGRDTLATNLQMNQAADRFAAAVAAVGKALANIVIGLNSPGHAGTAEAAARQESRFFQPANGEEAVIMGITEAAALAVPAVSRAAATTKVTHFTDAAGIAGIDAAEALRAGTFVTKASEVRGLTQAQVERALEIAPGKGAHSVTVHVPTKTLAVPANGGKTSGGAWQRQLTKPAKVKKEEGG